MRGEGDLRVPVLMAAEHHRETKTDAIFFSRVLLDLLELRNFTRQHSNESSQGS
jgi:hypothetical protein